MQGKSCKPLNFAVIMRFLTKKKYALICGKCTKCKYVKYALICGKCTKYAQHTFHPPPRILFSPGCTSTAAVLHRFRRRCAARRAEQPRAGPDPWEGLAALEVQRSECNLASIAETEPHICPCCPSARLLMLSV